MRILVDIDGVCLDLCSAVLDVYNQEWKDNLKYEDITKYDISLFVNPACGKSLYGYFERDNIYDKVNIIKGALDGVIRLRAWGHEVVFVTSGIFPAKVRALQKRAFLLDMKSDYHYAKDVIVAHDKSMIRGDLLIDDKPENLRGHVGLLFDQPWNKESTLPRVYDWQGVLKKVEEMCPRTS